MLGRAAERVQRSALTRPARWPVRWRLAAVSAGLTLVILLAFAFVVGRLVSDRLRDDFSDELRSAARRARVRDPALQPRRRRCSPTSSRSRWPTARRSGSSTARGRSTGRHTTRPTSGPRARGPRASASCRSRPRRSPPAELGLPAVYVQYARNHDHVDATIDRLWLFIAAGVLGGTLLAAFAGRRDRPPGDAADRLADRDRARDRRRPATPRGACRAPTPTTRSASWRARSSRCCARSTRRAPSASRRCRSSASSSPTPRTSCARR